VIGLMEKLPRLVSTVIPIIKGHRMTKCMISNSQKNMKLRNCSVHTLYWTLSF